MSSNELVALLRELQQAIDEHEARLGELEAGPTFTQRAGIEQRRRVVQRMRAAGLSIDRIAVSLGASKTTVARDVGVTAPDVPDRIVGVDGRRYRSRHTQSNGASAS